MEVEDPSSVTDIVSHVQVQSNWSSLFNAWLLSS
jgi:hypothetical protein